jgi:hypothetical protein
MNRALMVSLLVALGCTDKTTTDTTDDTTVDTTEDSGTSDSGDSGTTETPEVNPVITDGSALCDESDVLTLFVQANGWVSGALMFMQETGNIAPQYSESQPIDSYYADVPGKLEKLKSTLATGAKFVPRVSTVFTCADHIAADGVMTYIAAIFHQETNEAIDCFAFGADPQGLLEGKYKGTSGPPQQMQDLIDAGKCTIGANVVTPR